MGDDGDTGVHGLLQHRIELGRIHGDDAQGIHTLGNQILDDRNLLGGIGFGRPHQGGIDAGFGAEFFDAFFHAVEPVDAGDLDDRDKGEIAGSRGLCCWRFFCGRFCCIGGRCFCSRRLSCRGRRCSRRGCTGSDQSNEQDDYYEQR